MSNTVQALRLRGRRAECTALDRLTSLARSGQSQVLVLRGEAGIGKTALLEFVAERAPGFRAARVSGVESEMELAFAALHQLCVPLLDCLDDLPAPQRDALEIALGRSAGPAPDRFLVGLAVLNLIGGATKRKPLLFLVDDAQWIDRVSAQTLAFVARRLVAEPVCLIFAIRDGLDERRVDRPARTDPARTQCRRRPRVAGFGHPGPVGQSGARSNRRGNSRQPPGPAGTAQGTDDGGIGGRIRAAGCATAGRADRAHLPAADRTVVGSHPAAAADRRGRTGRRRGAVDACRRAAGTTPRRGRGCRGGGTDRRRNPGAVPSPTGAIRPPTARRI